MRRLLVLLACALPLLAGPREVDKTPRYGRAVILHPPAALTDAEEAELAARGVEVLHPLPGGRYLARVHDGATADIDVEPLTVAQKLHPSAVRTASLGRTLVPVNVVFQRDVTFDAARQAILDAGGALDVFSLRYLPSQRIEAKVPPSSLLALAEDERVFVVTGVRKAKIAAENAVTAQLSHVTELYSAPYGLSGEGVVASLFELAAAQASHVEFGGRLSVNASAGSGADRRHATHVAGTIAASGVNPAAKGMAPKVRLYEFCVICGDEPLEWLTLKDEKLAPLGVRVDNNSWGYIWGWEDGSPPTWNEGDLYWGAYDVTYATPIDEISIDRDILFVHSAGNDASLPFGLSTEWRTHRHYDLDSGEDRPGLYCVSKDGSGRDCPPTSSSPACTVCEATLHHPATPYDTIGTTAAAKNIITVGAINSDLSIIGFSSRGPAKDGRLKPDVVARGGNVLSTVPENSYVTLSGTSMSAPAVTGMAVLLTEQWRRTFGGANPHPAQLKALLIAGTDDIGPAGPDYTFGFGLVNAKTSADLIIADGGAGQRIRNLTFNKGANDQFEVPIVVDAQQNVRVVLNWADPAIAIVGSDPTQKSLVNDLDLRVVDPSGTSWLPYTLDAKNVNAVATRAANHVDNVEMVEIPAAAPGVYRIIARGTTVTQGPQDAVLVTNIRGPRPCVDVQEPAGGANDAAERATSIAASQTVFAGLCGASDVDFYTFTATKTGAVTVTITAGDTPLRATLGGTGISVTETVPANSTVTLSAGVIAAPTTITLKIEAGGAMGVEPQYRFTPEFPELRKPKRRSAHG
ncbi:MAG TPA: S8 family serine peptidase [Thermoanaerobaculia bacterium]|nr:S8 family serine peptidase [Thermoanaerobaculia bacterium]